ncbi:uncharacterized protein TNCV_1978431 [Trichonephila clavipes]|nr:uncharacterized protein TNCV_1978431 [Trichonephila clavipes]
MRERDTYDVNRRRKRWRSYFSCNRYALEVLLLEVVPFFQGSLGAIFQQDNASPHDAKTVRDFTSAQHMQLLLWSSYSPNISSMEHVRKFGWSVSHSSFVSRSFLKTNFCRTYKQYGILFHKQTFKICLTPSHVV